MINTSLFKIKTEWQKEWVNMPNFVVPTRNTELRNSINVDDIVAYNDQPTTKLPRYNIYIISKGRWAINGTAKSLSALGIEYKLVVEPKEYKKYLMHYPKNSIIALPDNFSELNQGSIPVRNWVWEHSLQNNERRHWILDDNINGFGIQKGGRRINSRRNGDFFALCEDFVDRYNNLYLSGIRYRFHHNYVKSPYLLNTRIYSCILVKNNIPYRWRGKYNEDTDLSLRILKDGGCTILFTWCYCNKAGTMSMKGGNTDTIYNTGDNRMVFAKSLAEQHPDVVRVTKKFGRWHHLVNYKPFRKNKLIRIAT